MRLNQARVSHTGARGGLVLRTTVNPYWHKSRVTHRLEAQKRCPNMHPMTAAIYECGENSPPLGSRQGRVSHQIEKRLGTRWLIVVRITRSAKVLP